MVTSLIPYLMVHRKDTIICSQAEYFGLAKWSDLYLGHCSGGRRQFGSWVRAVKRWIKVSFFLEFEL